MAQIHETDINTEPEAARGDDGNAQREQAAPGVGASAETGPRPAPPAARPDSGSRP